MTCTKTSRLCNAVAERRSEAKVPTIGTMTVKGSKQGLLIGDVLLKGKAVVLVLLLEAWLSACSGHAGHGAGHALCTLQAGNITRMSKRIKIV